MRGLEYGLWMHCLFLKSEDRGFLPGEKGLEVLEGPRAVKENMKPCRRRAGVVRAGELGLPQC